ncbi:MAG: hypothetical protein ABIP74_04005 [Candidatus Saccharimonas sp.]
MPQIIDTVRAYNFHAPAKVVAIDKRLQLTDRGTDIFYASSPEVDSQSDFNKNCQTQERTTAILGCFYKDKIFLYDLQNTELDGTLEVTAAHEMLHAAYQRLTILERAWLDKRIVAAYETVKNNATIKELMAYYSKAEPGAEVDELHSILGTVIAELSPELEGYYGRYFKNRAVVVALNTKYNQVFEEIKAESAAIEARLKAAEPQIANLLSDYDADRSKLEAAIMSFNARADGGKFSSQSAFYAERAAIVAQISALNARKDDINNKVIAYNADVAELNKISLRSNELYQSMNGAVGTETLQY